MSGAYAHQVIIDPPFPSDRVMVEFLPVRGSIVRIDKVRPDGAVARLKGPRSIRLKLDAASPPAGTFNDPVELSLAVTGEPVSRYDLRPLPVPGVGVGATQVASSRDWGPLYAARETMTNPAQAFFFELDRTTNPLFLDHATDISPEEKEDRKRLLSDSDPSSIVMQLLKRLQTRFGAEPRARLRPIEDVRKLSDLFRKATLKHGVGEDWATIGNSLLCFAAGHLMTNVIIESTDNHNKKVRKNIIVTAPDSFYIFLYAEFALAALELDVNTPMWNALLPYLVDMQRHYVSRFGPKASLTEFHGLPKMTPYRPTLAVQMHPDWDAMIRDNLRAAAPRFEPPRQ